MKNALLGMALLTLATLSCKKDNNNSAGGQLPDTSSSGKNFLACKVNGNVQVYSGLSSYMRPDGVSFAHYKDNIRISGSGVKDYKDILGMRVNEDSTRKVQVGTSYFFGDEYGQHVGGYFAYPPGVVGLEYSTGTRSGWIRFSRLDSIASGTFEFTAYYDTNSSSRKEPDTVHITEGRFDISRK